MRFCLFLVSAYILFTGCSTHKSIPQKNAFIFTIGEEQFEIISVNTESGEGTNYLSKKPKNGTASFTARDIDQDGTIDIVLKGEINIQEADIIYKEGISLARINGNYKERISLRTFDFHTPEMRYTVKSYLLDEDTFNNVFVIFNFNTRETFLMLDNNADGIIDSIEKGTISVDQANQLYKKVLEEGIKSERVVSKNGRFYVREDQPSLETASAIDYKSGF